MPVDLLLDVPTDADVSTVQIRSAGRLIRITGDRRVGCRLTASTRPLFHQTGVF